MQINVSCSESLVAYVSIHTLIPSPALIKHSP